MVEISRLKNTNKVRINDTRDFEEIREVLEGLLYVPNDRMRDKVIEELLEYFKSKFLIPEYKIKVFIAYQGSEPRGFITCQVHPHYTSYGRKCGTFGWINVKGPQACEALTKECEKYIKENRIRKLRGPINFPKCLAGIGFQVSGFEEQMLYGVAFTDPASRTLEYLQDLGYVKESKYSCLKVTQRIWNKGKKIDDNIIFRYADLEGVVKRREDIFNLVRNSFHGILPDSSGMEEKFNEFVESFAQIPKSFYTIPQDFDPEIYSNIPQFIDTWKACDLERIVPLALMALDRNTGELVGILLGLPDLFQTWNGDPITRVNVDSAMVKRGYFGRGIFSALNNLGQLTANLYGIDYFEGTSIWSNNEKAIETIFPHCSPLRKHYVVQKRV